jgi:hypothetical protein
MGWNVSCAYLVYCVSGILLRMSVAMGVRCATYSVRLAMDHVEECVLCLPVCRGS